MSDRQAPELAEKIAAKPSWIGVHAKSATVMKALQGDQRHRGQSKSKFENGELTHG